MHHQHYIIYTKFTWQNYSHIFLVILNILQKLTKTYKILTKIVKSHKNFRVKENKSKVRL